MNASMNVLQVDGEERVRDPGVEGRVGEEGMDQAGADKTQYHPITQITEPSKCFWRSQNSITITIMFIVDIEIVDYYDCTGQRRHNDAEAVSYRFQEPA